VSGLARGIVRTAKEFAAEHDASSDAGSDGGVKDDGVSAASAVKRLADGTRVAIVFDSNREPKFLPGHFGEGNIDPTWKIRRIQNDATFGIQRARRADPYHRYIVGDGALDCAPKLGEGNIEPFGSSGGQEGGSRDVRVSAYAPRDDFRSSNIDPEHCHCFILAL
jgi:hypothetical protein